MRCLLSLYRIVYVILIFGSRPIDLLRHRRKDGPIHTACQRMRQQ